EVCEWWPGTRGASAVANWMYGGAMFRLATGALVISAAIENNLAAVTRRLGRQPLVLRLPILVDLQRWRQDRSCRIREDINKKRHLVWCGDANGYRRDVEFLLRGISASRKRGCPYELVLVGPCTQDRRDQIISLARELEVEDSVVAKGFVQDEDLTSIYRNATALALPMWRDDRSMTRFPTKLGEYLASQRPVITCDVGEVGALLKPAQAAYFYECGNGDAFAEQLQAIAADPGDAHARAAKGLAIATHTLDYRNHSDTLYRFFVKCVERLPGH
ncbi:MAG TPA: glycosyltransferase, partial [Phycisphaerae bacterium]|nr:glycosyltransferase [Phycisphaerae bacterium]